MRKKLTILFLALLIPTLVFAFTYDWEIDYMEYADDAAAQAAYVSSDATPITSWSDTLDTNTGSYTGFTWRQIAAAGSISTSGKYIRVSLEASSAEGLDIDNVAIVERDGSTANGTTTPTEILFSGTSGINIAAGATEVSDWLEYPLDETKDYLLIADVGDTVGVANSRRVNDGGDGYYLTTANDSYNVKDMPGSPDIIASRTIIFNKLEVAGTLQSYSESTIIQQGTYSLKGVAAITDSLDDTLTRTLADNLDLSNSEAIEYDIYALRTGSNIKIGIHDSGGTTTEHTANVASSNTNQTESWDISGVSDANKDDIDSIIITIMNADAANTFYLDDIKWGVNAGGSWTFVN